VFVDGFFAESPDATVREFAEQYRRRYQTNPSLLAAQAYDAARVALEAVRGGATSGKGVREQLLKRQDLPTLGGPASFNAAGMLNRRVFVIQIKNGKLVQLN
jgi:ABC-type branched-subunit amino acid transport system substrate-binding protein